MQQDSEKKKQKRNSLTDTDNKLVVTSGGRKR